MLASVLLGGTGWSAGAAGLAPIDAQTDVAVLLGSQRPLRLDVTLNGAPAGGLQSFVLTPPDHLAAERRVLQAIGIAVPGDMPPDSLVDLDALTGVTTTFDPATQSVAFKLPDERRERKVYDARGATTAMPAPSPDWGGFLNYMLFTSEQKGARSGFRYSGTNASLDAHVFGPYGAFAQSAIVGDTLGRPQAALRLDTTYTILDQDRMLTERLGDTISGGLAWTRPIRLGGLQVQRDFALQPGLVTQPLPTFSGSAAVPSTVDVFVGSARMLTERVDPGPYQLVNIPNLSGGTANVVVTDATGRQTRSSLSLFNAAQMLQPGLVDYSVEAGFARRSYGFLSDDYDSRPAATGTFRAGVTPRLTVEGHAEAGAGVIDAGAGAVTGTAWGTFETALSASLDGGRFGGLVYGAFDTQVLGLTLHASAQWRTDPYDDLAGATARWTGLRRDLHGVLPPVSGGFDFGFVDDRPPKSLNQIAAYAPLPFGMGTASLSLIDLRAAGGTRTELVSASVSQPLPYGARLFTTVFVDLARRGGSGVLAGLTVPIGSDMSASLGGGAGLAAQRTMGRDAGSLGWQVADLGGSRTDRIATVDYRGNYGTVGAGVTQQGKGLGGTASLEGSVATMGGTVVLGNRIDDGFAVVDAGIPGVEVLQDNRRVGSTDPWGHLLVPGLGAYQPNRIAIDPLSLPARGETVRSESAVVPARASGVRVDFGGERDVQASTMVLVDAAGTPLPVGSTGRMDGSGEAFVVGYGGQAYLRHLAARNEARVETGTGKCRLAFTYDPGQRDPAGRTVPCS